MTKTEVVITAANTVELVESSFEPILAESDVLIETESSYISAGTELANYTGLEPQTREPGSWCYYPWRPGYANVGRVRLTGRAVTKVREGDRVFSFGKHASHIVVDLTASHAALVIKVPDSIPSSIAAASRMAGVAYSAPHLAEITINRWVAVYGLGAVGNLAAQIFRILGCRVIGIDPSAKRRDLAVACGVPYVLGGSPEDIVSGIKRITDGVMVKTAVDAVGDSRVILQCLHGVAKQSEVIILGTPRAQVAGDLTEAFRLSHTNWITIKGALEWMMDTYPGAWSSTTLYDKQANIFDWIARGDLQVAPLISHTVKPGQMSQAYDGLLNDKETYTGVVVDWS